jgi:hypothetical protein
MFISKNDKRPNSRSTVVYRGGSDYKRLDREPRMAMILPKRPQRMLISRSERMREYSWMQQLKHDWLGTRNIKSKQMITREYSTADYWKSGIEVSKALS